MTATTCCDGGSLKAVSGPSAVGGGSSWGRIVLGDSVWTDGGVAVAAAAAITTSAADGRGSNTCCGAGTRGRSKWSSAEKRKDIALYQRAEMRNEQLDTLGGNEG